MRVVAHLALATLLIGAPTLARAQSLDISAVTAALPTVRRPALAPGGNQRLLAAAARFERLCATAFDSSFAALKGGLAKAEDAARSVRRLLAADRRPRFDVELANLRIALHGQRRGAFARAAADCYRSLIEAVPGAQPIPKAADLMDYAGLRYRADLQSRTIRWHDMDTASHFARARWDSLAPRVRGADLRFQIEEAVNGMQIAAHGHNARLATRSARLELSLVGQIENQFAVRRGPAAMS